MTQWHFVEDSRCCGPIDSTELVELCRSGRIAPDTMVWRPGLEDWIPAGRIARLASEFGVILPQQGCNHTDIGALQARSSSADQPSPPLQQFSDSLLQVPQFWNPTSAVAWGLLCTAAFAAILISKNWNRLGEAELARQSMTLCYGAVLWCGVKVLVLTPVELFVLRLPSFLYFSVDLAILAMVYWNHARPQSERINQSFGTAYPRRPWLRVLSIGLASALAYAVVTIAFAVVLSLIVEGL